MPEIRIVQQLIVLLLRAERAKGKVIGIGERTIPVH